MISFKVDQETCIGCGECARDCPYLIIVMDGETPRVDPEREQMCIRCQHCLAVCPTGAVSVLGKDPDESLPLKNSFPDPDRLARLIMGRRSVRRFKDRPVDPGIISDLIAVTGHAPTGVNNRRLLMTVVDDAGVMTRLREETYAGIRRAVDSATLPERLLFFEGFLNLWEDKAVDVLYRAAPHLLAVSSPADGSSPEADCLIAMTTFELYAASRGLGTLWDGLAKWAMTDIAPELRERIGIPPDHVLGYVMVFGEPGVQYHRTVQRADPLVNRVVWPG